MKKAKLDWVVFTDKEEIPETLFPRYCVWNNLVIAKLHKYGGTVKDSCVNFMVDFNFPIGNDGIQQKFYEDVESAQLDVEVGFNTFIKMAKEL